MHRKNLCFKCDKAIHLWKEYREGGGGNIELNSTTIALPERQNVRPHTTSINESVTTFKRGHWMLESFDLKILVAEGGLEATLSLISLTRKDLVI